jgi:hypothetical protein
MIRAETGVNINTMDRVSLCKPLILDRMNESFNNPRIAEGSYLSSEHIQQLQKDSELSSIVSLDEPEIVEGVGTYYRIGVVTKQGYGHSVFAGVPEYPRSDRNIIVAETTALTTGLGGMNKQAVEDHTRDGHYFVMFGAEGSYKPQDNPIPESAITVANSVSSMLSFVNEWTEFLRQEGHSVDSEKIIVKGSSRGAIMSIGAAGLAGHFGLSVVYANNIAPRFPKKLSSPELKLIVSQILTESPQLMTLPLRLGLARSIRYVNTFDLNPYALVHHAQIGAAIASAELGILAETIDNNLLMDNAFFSQDGAHEKNAWDKKLEPFQNATNHYIHGRHMDIPLKRVQYPSRLHVNAVATCDNLGYPLTPENTRLMYQELLHIRRPIGRRALQIAV